MKKALTATGLTAAMGGILTTILSGVGLYIRTEIAGLRTSINQLNRTMYSIQRSIGETQASEQYMAERMNNYKDWLTRIETRLHKLEKNR